MDFCNAIAQLRIPPGQGYLGQGRAIGLLDTEIGPHLPGLPHTHDRNRDAPVAAAQVGPGYGLGGVSSPRGLAPTHSWLLTRLILSMGRLREEQLRVVLFDANNHYLADRTVADGSQSALHGTFRPIVSWALAMGARGLLLAHNHPSGSPYPSQPDIDFTHRIERLCLPLEIEMIDHILIAGRSAVSMRRGGWI